MKRADHGEYGRAAPSSRRCLVPGQLVRSLSGRDKGRYYLVLTAAEDGFVSLADGRKRPVGAPKRKNVRHLQPIRRVAADLAERTEGSAITNEEVRAAIIELLKVKEGE